jgi:hypothetical protein
LFLLSLRLLWFITSWRNCSPMGMYAVECGWYWQRAWSLYRSSYSWNSTIIILYFTLIYRLARLRPASSWIKTTIGLAASVGCQYLTRSSQINLMMVLITCGGRVTVDLLTVPRILTDIFAVASQIDDGSRSFVVV